MKSVHIVTVSVFATMAVAFWFLALSTLSRGQNIAKVSGDDLEGESMNLTKVRTDSGFVMERSAPWGSGIFRAPFYRSSDSESVAPDASDDDEFDENEPPRFGRPDLDALLVKEVPDTEWMQAIRNQVEIDLSDFPEVILMSTRCVDHFCKVELEMPLSAGKSWSQIDKKLAKTIARGETWFQTEDRNGETYAYIYVSAVDSMLPIAEY